MIFAALLAVVAAMVLVLVRLFAGPSVYDRVLAVNSFGTKTVLFLALFAFLIGRPDAIDIAILYAALNLVATIAVLKFVRYRGFAGALSGDYDGDDAVEVHDQLHDQAGERRDA